MRSVATGSLEHLKRAIFRKVTAFIAIIANQTTGTRVRIGGKPVVATEKAETSSRRE